MRKASFTVAAFMLTMIFTTPGVWAKGPAPSDSLTARVAALEAQVATLQTQLAIYQAVMQIVTGDINGLKGPHVIFTGVNVHIRNGTGYTNLDDVSFNGLGNLIVGYNESRTGEQFRTGSHNLVVGPNHSYSNTGGFVAGIENNVHGKGCSVLGGAGNTASGNISTVSGGGA